MWGNIDIGEGKKIWCGDVLYKNSCALVSFARPDQIKKISPICKSLVLDCAAFTFYMRGIEANAEFWSKYYLWVEKWFDDIDWFIIPDVIGGSEKENDDLLESIPGHLLSKGVPVWHSCESMNRLIKLCTLYERVAIGLVKEHKPATSKKAAEILDKAFECIYLNIGLKVKIHGLAMLDGRVIGKYPFDSADSAFVAVNVPKTNKVMTEVQCKLARTAIYKNKIELVKPPTVEEWVNGKF